MKQSDSSQTPASWNTYWHGAGDAAAYSKGGVSHPAVTEFWTSVFDTLAGGNLDVKLLDLAAGTGALTALAMEMLRERNPAITCVDLSAAAIAQIHDRWPDVNGLVADAADLPFDDAGFDVVVSQYGVEYAGMDAVLRAPRLVADGGTFAALMHATGSSIDAECRASETAIKRLRESEFVPLALDFFDAGFAAIRGGDRKRYDDAGRRLAPAVQAAEEIMAEFGAGVAGDTIARLYNDVGTVHDRIQHYDPNEVHAWLVRLDDELDAYATRMSSMREAALDENGFSEVCGELRERGFELQTNAALLPRDDTRSLGWALIATR